MTKIAVGIDIGGTNTEIGIVDKDGHILASDKLSTNNYPFVDHFVSDVATVVTNLMDRVGKENQLLGIGIGAPNGNFYSGSIEFAPNLRWKGIIKLSELFKPYFNVPIIVTNDANAAAIGEMVFGGAKNIKNFVMVTLGTGLGSGFVVDGKLVYGADGFAGELGHVTVDMNGRNCGCGRKGCLETYVSATGMVRTVSELLANMSDDSDLRNIPYNSITSKLVYEKAMEGDKVALAAFDYTARILGLKLADTVAITSPEAIFIFGGLAYAKNLIIEPVKQYMESYMLSIFKNKVQVLPSALMGTNIAVLGAAALIYNH